MDKCIYCDEEATSRDHIVPVTLAVSGRPKGPTRIRDTVPCCLECNKLLNSYPFPELYRRCGYLYKRLSKRYKRILEMPEWDIEEELNELSKRLQQSVLAQIAQKERVLHRLSTLKKRSIPIS